MLCRAILLQLTVSFVFSRVLKEEGRSEDVLCTSCCTECGLQLSLPLGHALPHTLSLLLLACWHFQIFVVLPQQQQQLVYISSLTSTLCGPFPDEMSYTRAEGSWCIFLTAPCRHADTAGVRGNGLSARVPL